MLAETLVANVIVKDEPRVLTMELVQRDVGVIQAVLRGEVEQALAPGRREDGEGRVLALRGDQDRSQVLARGDGGERVPGVRRAMGAA